MANTLVEKGVILFIGWNGEVQVEHTDLGILELLENLYSQGKSVEESVNAVMIEVGPDPYYNSRLYYYPLETSDMILKKLG
jgi:hypothetical protein